MSYMLLNCAYNTKKPNYISILVLLLLIFSSNTISVIFAAEGISAQYASLYLPHLPENIPLKDRLITEADPAIGLFLVATDQLRNSIFAETVILLIDHGSHGSIGLIIDRPSETSLSSVFPEVQEYHETAIKIHSGGPVNMNKITALIRSDKPLSDANLILDDVYATSNLSTLRDCLTKTNALNKIRVYSGYAGWWAGQLEREIMRGSWHVIEGDAGVVFELNHSSLWQKLQQQ